MADNKVFRVPSKEVLTTYGKWLPIVLAAFLAVYLSSNAYATTQLQRYHMYADWELLIPLFPPMILVYMSYVLVFVVVAFVLKTSEAIKGLAYSMLAMIGISGLIFVAFPGELGYQRAEYVAGFDALYKFLFWLDHPHNLFPSLHIGFASLCVMAMTQQTSNAKFHLALKLWFGLVCSSVILTHQHHFFDIGSAMLIGLALYKGVYMRTINSATSTSNEPSAERSY